MPRDEAQAPGRELNYDSRASLHHFLQERGLVLRKKWGQNFLVNRGAREKLCGLLELEDGELVWEIGPGLGAMTELILQRPVQLVAFEIDHGLIRCLEQLFSGRENFHLLAGDAAGTWPEAVTRYGRPQKILGNLPYASASAIISAFLEGGLQPQKMVFTVQKELALRMTASPGNKNYSSFSVFCQFFYRIALAGELKPGSFFPVPDVTSAIITLVPLAETREPQDRALFFEVVRSAFHARRKTLQNNLWRSRLSERFSRETIRRALQAGGLAPAVRGESLSVEQFTALADNLITIQREEH